MSVPVIVTTAQCGPRGPAGPAGAAGPREGIAVELTPNVSNEIDVVLDDSTYQLALIDGTLTFGTVTDAGVEGHIYFATIDIQPPEVGTGILEIPFGWMRFGGLCSIELAEGDLPIILQIRTFMDTIAYIATQGAIEC